MTVICGGIAGRPCCNKTQPAAGKYILSEPLCQLCPACAKALPGYIRGDVAHARNVSETEVQVRVVTRAPFTGRKVWEEEAWQENTRLPLSGTVLDIELLEGESWGATMSGSFTRALLDAIPCGG